MPNTYDAIVIGSGIGGLTFASLMAQLKGWRVLVLERHFKLGGFTHTFRRPGGYEWDVGVHYVGQMQDGSTNRQVFDLVTGGEVKWNPMPDNYDRYLAPGFQFDFVKGKANLRQALVQAFPAEEQGIDQYFRDVTKVGNWMQRFAMAEVLPASIGAIVRRINLSFGHLGLMTTGQYLKTHFKDERLRAVLATQWGDYGLPPAQSVFAIHALLVAHYIDGAWYPEGGAGVIAEAAEHQIRNAGGDLRPNHNVRRIIVENGRAVGVEVENRGEIACIRSPVIVSDAGAWTTFTKLAPGVEIDLDWDGHGFSVATLYLGLKRDPRELGFHGENSWIFESFNHDSVAANAGRITDGEASMCYLSFPSMKNPKAHAHTAEILGQLPYDLVAKYRDQPWRRRGPEYDALKARITDALLALVEKHYPGFRELVAYAELSTPITSELFTGHPCGSIYGYPATPKRFQKSFLRARTALPGLYLTGADAMTFGVVGAMMGGVITAALQFGISGFPKIIAAAAEFKRYTPAPLQPLAAAKAASHR